MIERLVGFIREFCEQKLLEAAREGRGCIFIDYKDLDHYDPTLADVLLRAPNRFFMDITDAMKEVDLGTEQVYKIQFRFENIPDDAKIRIKDLRSEHINKFVKLDGIVRRASEVLPEVQNAIFECPDCGTRQEIPQVQPTMIYPNGCDCGRKRGFKFIDRTLHDARYIFLEDHFEMTMGERPGEIRVFLKDDLTTPRMQKKTDPGARLEVSGVLRELPKKIDGVRSRQLDMFLEANYVRTLEQDFEEIIITPEDEKKIKEFAAQPNIHNTLIKSIAPSIYGLDPVKEAILMQLFGGVPQTLPDGSKIRGDIHLLLVGDPSVGKTQLLKLVSNFMPHGRYVSGKGTSAAGLCVTGDTWVTLEDGSFVQIGDLVEREFAKGKKNHDEGIEISADPTPLKVLSFDTSTLKLRPMNVSQYWRIKSPSKLTAIHTRSGREVTCTPNNPIPVLKNGEIIWKKAEDLEVGEFIAAPRSISYSPQRSLAVSQFIESNTHIVNGAVAINAILSQVTTTETIREFAKRAGVSEDSLYHSWRSAGHAPEMGTLGQLCATASLDIDDTLPDELELMQYNGHITTLPKEIDEDFMYITGLVAGDGDIARTPYGGLSVRLHSADTELLEKFEKVVREKMKLKPRYYKHPDRVAYSRFNSKIVGSLMATFGVPDGEKSKRIRITPELSRLPNAHVAAYLRGLFDTDGSVAQRKTQGSSLVDLTSVSQELIQGVQILLLRFGILSSIRRRGETVSYIRGRRVCCKEKYVLEIRGSANLKLFQKQIGFGLSRKSQKLEVVISKASQKHTNTDLVPEISQLLKQARQEAGLSAKRLFGYKAYEYERGQRKPSRPMLLKIVSKVLEQNGSGNAALKLNDFATSDLFWDEVKDIRFVDSPYEYVYDLTVEGDHSFVANGLIVHNTATVVRDEEFTGGWVLEAGAVVLSNKSVLAIDEFDKMSKEDQINLHEAMSTQTVSISKATIQTTLPARTAILAGCNPKFSRFDPGRSIMEQIDIPDSLMSRFDVKFVLLDRPNKENDERMVEHVITSRLDPREVKPLIEPEFLRKYIAYARQHTQPQMTRKTAAMFKNFFVELRSKQTGTNAPIPLTLRQYEALMRLSEASARIRLAEEVNEEDAERAIRLMKFSIIQLGFDAETGMLDIDKAEGGTSSAQRNRIRVVMETLEELEKSFGKSIPEQEILAALEDKGIDELAANTMLREMKHNGTLYEPRSGHLQKI